jgi:lipid-binding SYLF domain-containing protein
MIGGKFNPDQGIPRAALRQAKGVLILTTLAGGAVASGMVGSGIIVAR